MKTLLKAAAALMLMAAVMTTASCTKDPNNGGNSGGNNSGGNNSGGSGGGSSPTTEGIYLGIIGFNLDLYTKEIKLLNSSSENEFSSFIGNLRPGNLTSLYYADYQGLKKLKSYPKPPKLKNVALVTFTDGLDNASLDDAEKNPESYSSKLAYRTGLHNKIVNELIHGKNVAAYTIGLKGGDVQDEVEFQDNLDKLASIDNNAFLVSNMNEVKQRFKQIADSLYSTSTSVNVKLDVPPGYDEGTQIRFTFDITASGNPQQSSRYIAATYKRTSNSRILDNITYGGLADGRRSIESFDKQNGFYRFLFEDLKDLQGNPISQTSLNRVLLWRKSSNGVWEKETEFVPANSVVTEEDRNSALIMLVLDCTTSLGNDFSKMQDAAKDFVRTLVSSNH